MSALKPASVALVLIAAGLLAACGAENSVLPPQKVKVQSCISNNVAYRVRLDSFASSEDGAWSEAVGARRPVVGAGRYCYTDIEWPQESDVSFALSADPPAHPTDSSFAVFDCGGVIPAGTVPDAEALSFEFVRARAGYLCRIRPASAPEPSAVPEVEQPQTEAGAE